MQHRYIHFLLIRVCVGGGITVTISMVEAMGWLGGARREGGLPSVVVGSNGSMMEKYDDDELWFMMEWMIGVIT